MTTFALSFNMICDMIDQIIDFNKNFVAQKGYEKYLTDKYPDKKLAVLSCMDTRLTELFPAALGLKNGTSESNVMLASTLQSEEEFDLVKQSGTRFCLTLESEQVRAAKMGCISAKSKLSAF